MTNSPHFQSSQVLADANKEVADKAAKSIGITEELAGDLINANTEVASLDKEKNKRSAQLIVADAEKAKRAAELVIADAEEAKKAAELVIANKEVLFQNEEKVKLNADLVTAKAEALYDQLTKLPNRRLFIDRFNQAVLSSRRSKSYVALLFFDLDKFKGVNDNYGHAAGDLLLLEVADRMQKSIRDTDTIARFGGDEFVVLLNDLGSDRKEAAAKVESIAEKIRSSIAMPVTIEHGGQSLIIKPQCTVSAGATLFLCAIGELKTSMESMLALADKTMYQAKKAGGNRIQMDEVKI